MFSLMFVLVACLASALATAGICAARTRRRIADAVAGEQARHAVAAQHLREAHARELAELRRSLVADVEQLRERSRHPLKTLVGSLLG